MSYVADLISGARSLADDELLDHIEREPITHMIDGVRKRFSLAGRNILAAEDGGSVSDPEVYKNGVAETGITWERVGGSLTYDAAPTMPAGGADYIVEYYWRFFSDSQYLAWAIDGAKFVGFAASYDGGEDEAIGFNELLTDAVEHYMAHHAASKLANRTAWWFNTSLGNHSINKDTIATKFKAMSDELNKSAERLRDDVYKRHGKREAPSSKIVALTNIVDGQPKR